MGNQMIRRLWKSVSKFEATIKADSNRIFLPGNNLLDDLAEPSKKIVANFVLYFIATEMIICASYELH
jgi:hypothetical protein